jgi:hypothetical protein
MSSKQPDVGFRSMAETALRKAERQSFSRRSGRRTGSSRMVDVGGQMTAETIDLVREVAGVLLGTAASVGEELVGMASDLEPVVGNRTRRHRRSGGSASGDRTSSGGDATEMPVLALSDAAPGNKASGDFVAYNDGRDDVDRMGLRCAGLFGSDGARIQQKHVALKPAALVLPGHRTVTVTCTVEVPASAANGDYVGLIDSPDLPDVRLLVTLHVL